MYASTPTLHCVFDNTLSCKNAAIVLLNQCLALCQWNIPLNLIHACYKTRVPSIHIKYYSFTTDLPDVALPQVYSSPDETNPAWLRPQEIKLRLMSECPD